MQKEIPGIIFPETQSIELPMLPLRFPIFGRWTPTIQQVLDLEKRLDEYLKSSKHPQASRIRNRISSYKRQYVGYLEDKRRLVYVNALSGDYTGRNEKWRHEYIWVKDGGSNFFQAIYDYNSGRIEWFHVNSES